MDRFRIGLSVALQVVLAVIIFSQVNFIGCSQYGRADLTHSRRYTLSEFSTNFLSGLDRDVQITMAFLRNADLVFYFSHVLVTNCRGRQRRGWDIAR